MTKKSATTKRGERFEIPNEVPFPLRLHIMLQQTETCSQDHIVSWMPSGKSFKVHDREAFSKEILPEYFRSSNFRSFQRNLSVYQFARIWSGPEKGAYCHEHFIRQDRKLCTNMKRHVAPKKETSQQDDSSTTERQCQAQESWAYQSTRKNQKTEKETEERQQQLRRSTQSIDEGTISAHLESQSTGANDYQPHALLPPHGIQKQGQYHPQNHTVAIHPFSENETVCSGSAAVYFASPPTNISTTGSLSSEGMMMTGTSPFLGNFQQKLNLTFPVEVANPQMQPMMLPQGQTIQSALWGKNITAAVNLMSNFNTSMSIPMPMSPGPKSSEEDDPFLLDRLWSQTMSMATLSKNPLVPVRPSSLGFEQETRAVSWNECTPSRAFRESTGVAEIRAVPTPFTKTPTITNQQSRTNTMNNQLSSSKFLWQTTVEIQPPTQARLLINAQNNSQQGFDLTSSEHMSMRNPTIHHDHDHLLQDEVNSIPAPSDGSAKRVTGSNSDGSSSSSSSNNNNEQLPFRDLW